MTDIPNITYGEACYDGAANSMFKCLVCFARCVACQYTPAIRLLRALHPFFATYRSISMRQSRIEGLQISLARCNTRINFVGGLTEPQRTAILRAYCCSSAGHLKARKRLIHDVVLSNYGLNDQLFGSKAQAIEEACPRLIIIALYFVFGVCTALYSWKERKLETKTVCG